MSVSRVVAGILKTARDCTAAGCSSSGCSGKDTYSSGSGNGCSSSSGRSTASFFIPADDAQHNATGGTCSSSSGQMHDGEHPAVTFTDSAAAAAAPADSPSGSSSSGSSVRKKRALFVDPICKPYGSNSSMPTCSRSSSRHTCTVCGTNATQTPGGLATRSSASNSGSQTSRAYRLSQRMSHDGLTPQTPLSARDSCCQPVDIHLSSGASSMRRNSCSPSGDCQNSQSNSGSISRQSSCLVPPKTPRGSIMVEPCPSSSSSVNVSGGKTSSQNNTVNHSPRSASHGGSGNGGANNSSGSLSCVKHYGAWYLKTRDWEHVNTCVSHQSTWQRQSKLIADIDEQQRFAEQVQQLANPTPPDPTTSAAVETLASIVEGLEPTASQKLSTINTALLITNTWAVSSVTGESLMGKCERAEAEAAAAAQRYYKQLHDAAKQQAKLNAQVKGSYGLKAYKDYMQSKGYRESASLQRLPNPTDDDIRLAALRQQQELKEQQRRQLQQLQLSRRRQHLHHHHHHHQAGPDSLHGSNRSSANGAKVQQQEQQKQDGLGNMLGSTGGSMNGTAGYCPYHHHHQQDGHISPDTCSSAVGAAVQQQQQQALLDGQPGSNHSSRTGAVGSQQQQQGPAGSGSPDSWHEVQPGSKCSSSNGASQQQQQHGSVCVSWGTSGDSVAISAVAPAGSQPAGLDTGELGSAGAVATSTTGSTAAAAAAAISAVPKLNLSEVNCVVRQLHELKKTCHAEFGLDAQDFDLLESLLTTGRSAVVTSANNRSTAGGSSSARGCDTTRCSSSTYYGGSWTARCSSHSSHSSSHMPLVGGTSPGGTTSSKVGSTTPTASAAAAGFAGSTLSRGCSPRESSYRSGSKSARAAICGGSSSTGGGVAQLRPLTVRGADRPAAGAAAGRQCITVHDNTTESRMHHHHHQRQQQQWRLQDCYGKKYASAQGGSCNPAQAWRLGSSSGFFAAPLRTQSTGGIGCMAASGNSNSGESDGSSSDRMTIDGTSDAASDAQQQQQQEQWVAALVSKQQQACRNCSTAGSIVTTTTTGRLSSYARTLLAPVSVHVNYTLSPRSAAGPSMGANAATASHRRSLAGHMQCAARSPRLASPSLLTAAEEIGQRRVVAGSVAEMQCT